MFLILQYLKSIDKLKGGKALDLGCHEGRFAKKISDEGYIIDAVDKNPEFLKALKEILPEANTYQSDVADFLIKENYYDLIVARNILSFLPNKEAIFNLIEKMYQGLNKGGIMYFNVFGPRDPWAKDQKNMTFVSYDDLLKNIEYPLIYSSTGYGLGTTMKKDLKYWDNSHFVIEKNGN